MRTLVSWQRDDKTSYDYKRMTDAEKAEAIETALRIMADKLGVAMAAIIFHASCLGVEQTGKFFVEIERLAGLVNQNQMAQSGVAESEGGLFIPLPGVKIPDPVVNHKGK